jgi:hypothetical protein
MNQSGDADLLASARLKNRSDETLLRRIETAKAVYWLASVIVVGVVAVTLWVANIQHTQGDLQKDVNYNRSAIQKMWQHVFGYPLP